MLSRERPPGSVLAASSRLQPQRIGTAWAGECEAAQPLDPSHSRRRHGPLKLCSELGAQGLFALNIPYPVEEITVGLLRNPNPLRSWVWWSTLECLLEGAEEERWKVEALRVGSLVFNRLTRGQRQENLCELRASLGYVASSNTTKRF